MTNQTLEKTVQSRENRMKKKVRQLVWQISDSGKKIQNE